MAAFRHILFPVDFSDRSNAIRPYVKAYAERFHAKLTLLNAIETPPPMGGMDPSFPVVFETSTVKPRVLEMLQAYLDVPGAKQVAADGDPTMLISDYARENGVDLIMMATHGYGKFRSLLMGSVVSKVLHDVNCAVWTAPHTEDSNFIEHLPCREILVAVDPAPGQADVIHRAAELAKEFGSGMRLVHAVPGATRQPAETGGDEFRLFLMGAARESVAQLQAEAGTSLEVCIEAGSVADVVHAAAVEYKADLVIMGRGVMHETFGRLRTASYGIIRRSPCPVLSL
jgi:nucleotide-binding universal stress UspA family protein